MVEPDVSLKQRLRNDLTTAMKSRDQLRARTLRMALAAITEAEVAGKTATVLTDHEVVDVLTREAKKRREADDAFRAAGRDELADRERDEATVLRDYLPEQLTPDQIRELVTEAIASTGAGNLGAKGLGKVMGAVTPHTRGRADGAAVAAEVRRQLC